MTRSRAATSFGDVPLPMNKRIPGRPFACEAPAVVGLGVLTPAIRENNASVRRTRRAACTKHGALRAHRTGWAMVFLIATAALRFLGALHICLRLSAGTVSAKNACGRGGTLENADEVC